MRSSFARRRHPLAAANAALEHLVLRHFGLQLNRSEVRHPPPRPPDRAGGPETP
jgi:hypothetical protein